MVKATILIISYCFEYWNGMEWNIEFRPKAKHWTHWVIQRRHEKMIDEIVKR